jgi:hypothetical protein
MAIWQSFSRQQQLIPCYNASIDELRKGIFGVGFVSNLILQLKLKGGKPEFYQEFRFSL